MNNSGNPRSFVLQFMIFCIPLALYVAISAVLLVSTGEVIDIETAARIQLENPTTLFGRAYRDDFRAFKYEATRLRKPEVLALGSSRVMQFRSAMFPGVEFYNAGGAAANIYELRSFLEQLPLDSRPSTVIIGLDQDWFHPLHAERARYTDLTIRTDNLIEFSGYINLSRLALADLINGKLSFTRLLVGLDPYYSSPAIGIRALQESSGFRSDGSYLYGSVYLNPMSIEERRDGVLAGVYAGGHRFEPSSTFDMDALEELLILLNLGRVEGIQIIGFLPPYSPVVYEYFESSGDHGYMFDLARGLEELFTQYGFSFIDATDGGRFGVDTAFVDGFHGGEAVYLKILLELYTQQPEAFPQSLRKNVIMEIINNKNKENLIIFDIIGNFIDNNYIR